MLTRLARATGPRLAPSARRGQLRAMATAHTSPQAQLLAPRTRDQKVAFVDQLLAAKAASGKTFDDIAAECGWTNAYTAQLFFNQAQLKPDSAGKLKKAVPHLSDEAIAVMQHAPMRGWDPELAQEPHVYRMLERAPAEPAPGEDFDPTLCFSDGSGARRRACFAGVEGRGLEVLGRFMPRLLDCFAACCVLLLLWLYTPRSGNCHIQIRSRSRGRRGQRLCGCPGRQHGRKGEGAGEGR